MDDTTSVLFAGEEIKVPQGKSLLETMEGLGIDVPSSCRAGICQSCLLKTSEGQAPASAQKGLKPTLQTQGYFLACLCYPQESFSCVPGDDAGHKFRSKVMDKEALSEDVVRIRLQVPEAFRFKGGQFVNLRRDDGLLRSYSIASLPADGHFIDLHVRRLPEGQMSSWLHETVCFEDEVEIRGPLGDCFYLPGDPEQPLLLVGTGTGIAPLYAIVRDALAAGHCGPIRFYQGALNSQRLYLVQELSELAATHSNFEYQQCLLEKTPEDHPTALYGKIDEIVLEKAKGDKQARAFLCGDPQIVNALRKRLFLAGFSLKNIQSDAFVTAAKV